MELGLELQPLNLPADNERPIVIAGPCSAETEEQVMTTARQLKELGCHNFRAGVWKPRTKPGGFEGHGEQALPWLQRVKAETGMNVATEKPAMYVNEMYVETLIRCCCVSPSSAISALYGVQ